MSGETYVYAALLDVLGYKDLLKSDRDKGQLQFKDQLKKAMAVLSHVNEAEYQYQAISDTVLLTCAKREHLLPFLKMLREVQIAFLNEGLLIRGGVTYAQHFKSAHLTYSHAIARAHELEVQSAVYPRIVIDENILAMFDASEELDSIIQSRLVTVWNGINFLNILDAKNWQQVYAAAKSIFLAQEAQLRKNEKDFLKHVWLENYLFSAPDAKADAARYIPAMKLLT